MSFVGGKQRRGLGYRVLMLCAVLLLGASVGLSGCKKLKKMMSSMTETKPKKIKDPKIVIKITKLSKAVRIRGGHKHLIIKALKKAGGYRESSIDWGRRHITVGHTDDADTDKFLDTLRDYGYGVKLVGGDD